VENAPLFYSEEELFNVKGKVTKIVNSLGLVTNAVVLWNIIYVQATLNHLRQQPFEVREENEARLSPLVYGHVNMLGHYTFTLAENILKGELRPLNQPTEMLGIP